MSVESTANVETLMVTLLTLDPYIKHQYISFLVGSIASGITFRLVPCCSRIQNYGGLRTNLVL